MRTYVSVVALVLAPSFALAAVDSGVSLEVLARTTGSGGGQDDLVVRDGGVLRTGDGIQLHVRVRRDAYVYVIAYGSSNSAALVHPFSGKSEDARLPAGSERIIPQSDQYLPLDTQEGRETLFTLVSDTPVQDIAGLMARMEAKGSDLVAVAAVVHSVDPGSSRLTFRHLGEAPLVGVDLAGLPRSGRQSFGTEKPAAGLDLGGHRFASEAALLPPDDAAPVVGPGLATLSRPAESNAESAWTIPPRQAESREASSAGDVPTPTEPTEPPTSAAKAAPEDAPDTVAPAVASVAIAPDASQPGKPEVGEEPVSAARKRARERAGIDSAQYQSILSGLPAARKGDGKSSEASSKLREVGVLSAVGDRIRALERQDPLLEQRIEALGRQVPVNPAQDSQEPSEVPGEQSLKGAGERVSARDSSLPATTQ